MQVRTRLCRKIELERDHWPFCRRPCDSIEPPVLDERSSGAEVLREIASIPTEAGQKVNESPTVNAWLTTEFNIAICVGSEKGRRALLAPYGPTVGPMRHIGVS
jgi:hypothetical protein